MINVASHSHFQCSCQGFEYAFDLVMLVLSFGLDVQVHLRCVAQTLEEVQEHFGRHFADFFAMEFGIPNQPGATAEIQTG